MSLQSDLNWWPLPYHGSALPTELCRLSYRAGDETRTRDPQLGRLMLYQLSYSRLCGPGWIWTTVGLRRQIYSLLPLPTRPPTQKRQSHWRDSNPRHADYKSAALANWATKALSLYKKALLTIASQFNIFLFKKTTRDLFFLVKSNYSANFMILLTNFLYDKPT